MGTEAVVHRHKNARRNRVCDLFGGQGIDGIIPADRDEQRIAALDLFELFLAQLMAEVAAVHERQALGAQNVDGVLPAQRSALFVVKGRDRFDRKGAFRPVSSRERHGLQKGVVAVGM